MFRHLLACFALCLSLPALALPPPVRLGIPNLPQQTQVWCWAAVAQQIIAHRQGLSQTPPQCALVAVANGAHPQFCCGHANPACVRTGSMPQIAGLIQQYGGRSSGYAPPADPDTLYRTLASGRPVILEVASGIASSHVVVLTGMHYQATAWGIEVVLHINDPLAIYTQPVPYSQLRPLWTSALVVH